MATVTYLETLSSKPRARTDDIPRPSARQEPVNIADRIGEDRNTTIIERNRKNITIWATASQVFISGFTLQSGQTSIKFDICRLANF
jgi:hypothetical protein